MCYMDGRARDVGVRELRQNLGVYLKRVAAGETLRITEQGNPVAILAPVPERMTARDRLIASGRVIPASGDLLDLGPPRPLDPAHLTGIGAGEALELERAERLP